MIIIRLNKFKSQTPRMKHPVNLAFFDHLIIYFYIVFIIRSASWNLDMCQLLLPEIYELLQSEHKL